MIWVCAIAMGFAALFGSETGAEETIDAGPFSVDVAPQLTARFNGTVLFGGERCAVLRSGGYRKSEPSPVGAIEDGKVFRDGNTVTLIARSGRNLLRREVKVTPQALELTWELRVFGDTGGTHLRYELLTPIETLDGSPYRVTHGLLRRPRTTTTSVFKIRDTKPFNYLFQTALYLAIDRPRLRSTIDFNPMGAWQGASNYGENWSASPYHDGESVYFAMLAADARNGGTFIGKVIVRAGDTPYEAIHRNDGLNYTTDFPAALSINFTETDNDKRFQSCRTEATGGLPFGWRNSAQVRITQRAEGGLLRRDFAHSLKPGGEGLLDLKLRSGMHLLTLNLYDAQEATGPFSVHSADGALLSDVSIPRNRHWDKSVPLRVRDGKATIRFSGKWKINSLTVQTIMHEEEDFLFEKPWWNMNVLEPDL